MLTKADVEAIARLYGEASRKVWPDRWTVQLVTDPQRYYKGNVARVGVHAVRLTFESFEEQRGLKYRHPFDILTSVPSRHDVFDKTTNYVKRLRKMEAELADGPKTVPKNFESIKVYKMIWTL